MPFQDIEICLGHLKKHWVIPIILWDKNEYENLPRFGIVSVDDPESGEETTIFLRKKTVKQIKNKFIKRKEDLKKIFFEYDSPPFFVENDFDTNAMTQYFNEYFHV